MDHRELAPQSAWTNGRSNLVGPKFWLIGIAFLATYFILNILTARYQFHELGITLWSPDNGLSVLLLIEGTQFAPFVLLGEVLVDVLINRVHHSLYVTILAEFALTLGYAAFAAVLRDILKFSPRRANLADVISMLSAVPVGAALTSLIYCGTLYLAGSLPGDQFYPALRHFWIGDTLGIIVSHSGGDSGIRRFYQNRVGPGGKTTRSTGPSIIAGSFLGFGLLHSATSANAYHLFYLLFLPIIWIGLREGYVGVAIALVATQTTLFLTASSHRT